MNYKIVGMQNKICIIKYNKNEDFYHKKMLHSAYINWNSLHIMQIQANDF